MPEPEETIAIELDVVLLAHREGVQGAPAYDECVAWSAQALEKLSGAGYRLVVTTTRDLPAVREWLEEHDLLQWVSEVTNIKPVAKVYIDSRALHWETWEHCLTELTLRRYL